MDIAETVEKLKRQKKDGKAMEGEGGIESGTEEVMLKATGKAIQKCLELGLWFQQREEYRVRLETRSVAAIDDIAVNEDEDGAVTGAAGESAAVDDGSMQVDADTAAGAGEDCGSEENTGLLQTSADRDGKNQRQRRTREPPDVDAQGKGFVDIPESRVRYASSLEVFVSLR